MIARKSKRSICTLFTILVFANVSTAGPAEEKGLAIAKKVEAANEGFKGEEITTEMALINAHGDKILRKMTFKVKEGISDGDKSIITFLWPADVKGTKMLTWTHKKGDDDQWLYMPSHKKVRRISSRSKTGSFMASEFSYEDLSANEVEKYNYRFIKDEKLEGKDTWVVDSFPKDKKSGYTKVRLWVSKQYMNNLKADYYNRRKELFKTAIFSDYKKHKKWWRPGKITMVNNLTKKSSILTHSNRKLGVKFSDRDFHKNKLNR